MKEKRFNFGINWQDYSNNILDNERFKEARTSMSHLVGIDRIKGKTIVDVGCGSGIFSLAAKDLGAKRVLGLDLSPESISASRQNMERLGIKDVELKQFDVLKDKLKDEEKFDVVYSWGVLHHTGKMWEAVKNAMSLVNDGGIFVIAIYNRHWSSPAWYLIKQFYTYSPRILKALMIYLFSGVIFLAKFAVTFRNPLKMKRGMNFYYNVIDWVGGYPYEYASKNEIVDFFKERNFSLLNYQAATVPTGCNEFVFSRDTE